MYKLSLFALLATVSCCLAQPAPVPLHGLNDLQGLNVNNSSGLPDTKLEISTAAAYVTEGTGCLHARSVSPKDAKGNTYLSFILTTKPVDIRGKALAFDAATSLPKETQALYVRGYDAEGKAVVSWMSWGGPLTAKLQGFELSPGVSDERLGWEAEVIKSDNRAAIVRWEFYIGTHDPATAYDLYLDNLRLVPSNAQSFNDVKEPHKLTPETPLVVGGKTQAIIVAPDDKQWQALGQEVAATIRKAGGADVPVRLASATTNKDLGEHPTIILGNIANNRALLFPYSHMMTFADGVFPGAGGYELRTACDPFGTGPNLIVLGATDLAGGKLAVAAFAKALKPGADVTVPRLSEVKPAGTAEQRWGNLFTQTLDDKWLEGQQASAESALKNGAHTGLFGQIASLGEQYALTGRPEYAKAFVWLARRAQQHVDTKPDTFGGPWGMDSDFMSNRVIPAWDAVEECPALTPADRLEVAKILFRWVSEAVLPEGSGAAGTAASGAMVSNHGTFAALGTFCAGEFFSRYYGSGEGKQWLKIGDRCFQNLAASTKAHEDCNGYQWLTNWHNIRYALLKGDLTIFENGTVRRLADYAIFTMNNLGYQVPYGDTGAWVCWFSEMPVLRAAEWYYRDGRYQWAVDLKAKLQGRQAYGEFDCQAPTKEPTDLLGARAWALEPRYFKADKGELEIPQAQAFDKLAFRQSFDPKSPYLLLDGLSNGGHKHLDGNSVLQWTENERIWLCDADYYKSLPKYHNTVLIVKDGQSAQIPNFVELENATDLPAAAVSVSKYKGYAGVDWRRSVIQLKGAERGSASMFIVADQMTANEAGDYSFRAVWQTVGNVKVNGNALDIEQGGQWARFAVTPDARIVMSDDPVTGKNWASYPYAGKPIVRVMQAVVNRKLKVGQRVTLFTVLQASGEKPSTVKVERLKSDNEALITGSGEPVFADAGESETAEIGLMTPTVTVVAGAKEMPQVNEAAGRKTFAQGADLQFDQLKGEGVYREPALTRAEQKATELKPITWLKKEPEAEWKQVWADMARDVRKPEAQAAQAQVPSLVSKWDYRDKLGSYLLTNNADAFEAVDAGAKITCAQKPLAENVFGGGDVNKLDNLTDGILLSTDGGVMWDVDQSVTLEVTLDKGYDLEKLGLKEWFASSSSKNKLFQLGRAQVVASSDGFKADLRTLADVTDKETYGNWGAPSYGPRLYEFPLKGNAKALRITLTPRPGTAIYLAELQLWGNRPGLEIDLATRVARGVPVHQFSALKCADLNGDKQDEILAGSSNGNLYCFSSDGKLLWKLDCGAPINVLNTVDFDGSGKPVVIAGCMDAKAVACDASGKQLWVFNPPYYKRAGHVRVVFPLDPQGNGKQIAVIGAENWYYYGVDGAGKMLWRRETVHASTAGCAADLDGNKQQEVVAGTEYYWWHAINGDGSERWGYHAGPCVNAAAAGDLDGDGKQEAIFGSADTIVHVVGDDGKARYTFNTGDEVTSLACADVNGDGKDEVLVGSLSFNLYCLDGTGKALWRNDLGSEVRVLAVYKTDQGLTVAAGCADGTIHVCSAVDGKPVAQFKAGGSLLQLAAAKLGATQALAASASDGNLQVLTTK